MFMVHDKLKVALVTEHIPIRLISNILTKALFNKKIEQVINSLKKIF